MTKKDWKYVTKVQRVYYLSTLLQIQDYNYEFSEGKFIQVANGIVKIDAGYAHDGCSCSPDFRKALPSCVLHDALMQCVLFDPKCPFKTKHAHLAFKSQMNKDKFWGASLYYWAVASIFGRIYRWWKHGK